MSTNPNDSSSFQSFEEIYSSLQRLNLGMSQYSPDTFALNTKSIRETLNFLVPHLSDGNYMYSYFYDLFYALFDYDMSENYHMSGRLLELLEKISPNNPVIAPAFYRALKDITDFAVSYPDSHNLEKKIPRVRFKSFCKFLKQICSLVKYGNVWWNSCLWMLFSRVLYKITDNTQETILHLMASVVTDINYHNLQPDSLNLYDENGLGSDETFLDFFGKLREDFLNHHEQIKKMADVHKQIVLRILIQAAVMKNYYENLPTFEFASDVDAYVICDDDMGDEEARAFHSFLENQIMYDDVDESFS